MPVSNEYISGTIGVAGATITTTSYVQPQKQTYASVRFDVESRTKRVKSYYPQPSRLTTSTFTYEGTLETIDESDLFTFSEEKGFGMWTPELATGGGAGSGGSAPRVPVSTSWTPTRDYIGDVLIIGIAGGGGGGTAGTPGNSGDSATSTTLNYANPYGIAAAGRGGAGGTAGGQGSSLNSYLFVKDATFTAGFSYSITIPTASKYGTGGTSNYWRNIYGTAEAINRDRDGAMSPAGGATPTSSPNEATVSIGSHSVAGGTGGSTYASNCEGTPGGYFADYSSGYLLSGAYIPARSFWSVNPTRAPKLTTRVIDIQDDSEVAEHVKTFSVNTSTVKTWAFSEQQQVSDGVYLDPRLASNVISYTTMSLDFYVSRNNTRIALSVPGTGGYPGRFWNMSCTQLTSSVPLYLGYTMLTLEPAEEGEEAVERDYNLFWVPTVVSDDDIQFTYEDEGLAMTNNLIPTDQLSASLKLNHSTSSIKNELRFNIRSEYTSYDVGSAEAVALGLEIPAWEPSERRSTMIALLKKPLPPIFGGIGGAGGFGGCGGQGGIAYITAEPPGPMAPYGGYGTIGVTLINAGYEISNGVFSLPVPETSHYMTDEECQWIAEHCIAGPYYYPTLKFSIPKTVSYSYPAPGEPGPDNAIWCSGSNGDKGTEGAVYLFNLRPNIS